MDPRIARVVAVSALGGSAIASRQGLSADPADNTSRTATCGRERGC